MPRNLLIGAITNYGWGEVAPFFNSYMQAGFENCDCVMFTGNMTDETNDRIRRCGVDVRPIPERFSGGCVNDFRWELYKDYLKPRVNEYGIVFTDDVRDTIFQRDVFSCCGGKEAFLGVALEEEYLTEKINKDWLVKRYGDDIYSRFKNERIICTGTVWGTPREFLCFASAMSEHINSTQYPYFRVCDQATGNWLIYHEKLFSEDIIVKSDNYDGYVMTIGFIPPENIKINSSGLILNGKGEIVPVVHQHDRNPATVKSVLKRYSYGMSFSDRFKLRHDKDFIGRVMCFIDRVKKKGLAVSLIEAVKRRIH